VRRAEQRAAQNGGEDRAAPARERREQVAPEDGLLDDRRRHGDDE
jgi:hypothetical protein